MFFFLKNRPIQAYLLSLMVGLNISFILSATFLHNILSPVSLAQNLSFAVTATNFGNAVPEKQGALVFGSSPFDPEFFVSHGWFWDIFWFG